MGQEIQLRYWSANSAAAVEVAARRSATKSARVVSVSCPTLEIIESPAIQKWLAPLLLH